MNELSVDDLRVFVAALEHGSLNAAARALKLPKSTVSRRLARLEEQLSARLVHRTRAGLVQTDAGRVLLEPAQAILEQLAAVGELVRAGSAEPRGRLRVSLPQDLAGMPEWMEFPARYPKVALELEFSNRYVDVLGESFDVALRAGRGDDNRLIVKRLGSYPLYALASASHVAAHGVAHSREQLEQRDGVLLQPFRGRGGRRSSSERGPRHVIVNDPLSALQGALRGLGVAFLAAHVCGDHLASGDLVPIYEQWNPLEVPVYAAYPDRRYMPAALARFIEFAGALFGEGARGG